MYSSSEVCGNADLLRKLIQYAADGRSVNGVGQSAGQDLNPQPTVAPGQAFGISSSRQAADVHLEEPLSCQIFAGEGRHSLFVQPSKASHAWPDTQLPRRESETSSAPTLHQPIPCRPKAQQHAKTLQFLETGQPQFKFTAAHQALSDLTNKERAVGFPDQDTDDKSTYDKSEEDEAEDLDASCSPFRLDDLAFRRYDSDPTAGYYSEPGCLGDLERLHTLGSQESAWTVLLPRQRRRKCEKPARAPEAVGPEWYAEQRLAKRIEASLLPSSLSSEPMQLRRARSSRKSEDAGPGAEQAAAAAAATCAAVGAGAGPASALDSKGSSRECEDCGTTQTPLWRQYEDSTYCNACGLRRKRADGAYVRSSKTSRS